MLLRPRCMECLPGAEDIELVTESYCFCPLTPHMSGLVQYLSPVTGFFHLGKCPPGPSTLSHSSDSSRDCHGSALRDTKAAGLTELGADMAFVQ